LSRNATPGRRVGRSGVLLSALLALVACDAVGGGATIQLDDGEVRLPFGAEVHDVVVGGAGAADTLRPVEVEADPGDAIRFVVTDHRTHALAFDADALTPPVRQFLESTMQLRGPPLVNEGAAWVVSLADAPVGRYPFLCRTHGARGRIAVGAEG
jgi:plastocyanin